jgi:hypothetical protein
MLIVSGTGTSYHNRFFINITVCYVTSLAHTKAHSEVYVPTQLGLASGLLVLSTHKTDVL